ncbi:hypothetical protein FCV25MIE_28194 [Fagus crenata]
MGKGWELRVTYWLGGCTRDRGLLVGYVSGARSVTAQGQRQRKRLLGEIGAGVVKSRPMVLVARDDSGDGGLRSVLGSWDRGHRRKGLSMRAGGGPRMVAV